MSKLLEIKNLHTSFFTFAGEVKAVRGVDIAIEKGEIVGIVGESGSGKSVTMLSSIGLLAENGKVVDGSISFRGEDLKAKSNIDMRKIRNAEIAMVFQDSMTALNPNLRVQLQIVERIRAFNKNISRHDAKKRAVELLEMVKIPEAEKRVHAYPFEMSGGMRQRVMFAMAIANNPALLIADEPTTALDVTIQSQILKLIKQLRHEIQSSIIIITHDLGVVAETCERVIVMYGGMIMEEGTVHDIFYKTAHPYTMGLKKSIPDVTGNTGRLFSIPGTPPSLLNPPKGCPFAARCDYAMGICAENLPPFYSSGTHKSRCWLLDSDCPDSKGLVMPRE